MKPLGVTDFSSVALGFWTTLRRLSNSTHTQQQIKKGKLLSPPTRHVFKKRERGGRLPSWMAAQSLIFRAFLIFLMELVMASFLLSL